ncbi:hypothetical protein DBV05_g12662 [Lasiodiplodia theobromae]|uniref:Uncharacterized protein n=1 Tax=Lasiodiplodia theobromae TaxID=45133 RepID=A0A5N5CTI4_9PEZI|nr:hypothetical protein DBV05_g12662 [Lasiodiplodia theobromae]
MQRPYSNTFTPINNPMDQTHEMDEHLFDDEDNMDLSGLPHGDVLHDTSHDPAWEPDYDSYELPDDDPPSYEESTSHHRHPQSPNLALTDDDDSQTTSTSSSYPPFSPTPSQPQPIPQPRPRPRLRRVLARISSSSPPSPPLPPVTTYSSAHSPPRQTVHDRTSTTSESPDGGVPLDPTTATTAIATTVPALICHHAVPLPAAASGLPIPPRCPPCTTVMHRAYTLQMKMEWDIARLDPDTSHAERSAACRAYFRARADEQNYQDELEDGGSSGRAEEALREAAARRHRGAQRAVFFEAGTPLVSRGRAAGAFKRESRGYVPGKWAGEWEDTSGMRQSFSEYYDVMADYDEEAIVDDDDEEEEEYYDEDDDEKHDDEDDEEMCDDEDDDEEYKYYEHEGYAAGME